MTPTVSVGAAPACLGCRHGIGPRQAAMASQRLSGAMGHCHLTFGAVEGRVLPGTALGEVDGVCSSNNTGQVKEAA